MSTTKKIVLRVGEDVEELEFSYTVGWNIKQNKHFGK